MVIMGRNDGTEPIKDHHAHSTALTLGGLVRVVKKGFVPGIVSMVASFGVVHYVTGLPVPWIWRAYEAGSIVMAIILAIDLKLNGKVDWVPVKEEH